MLCAAARLDLFESVTAADSVIIWFHCWCSTHTIAFIVMQKREKREKNEFQFFCLIRLFLLPFFPKGRKSQPPVLSRINQQKKSDEEYFLNISLVRTFIDYLFKWWTNCSKRGTSAAYHNQRALSFVKLLSSSKRWWIIAVVVICDGSNMSKTTTTTKK